jgi:hypothetical protein
MKPTGGVRRERLGEVATTSRRMVASRREGRNLPKRIACPERPVFEAGYGFCATQSPDLAARLRGCWEVAIA